MTHPKMTPHQKKQLEELIEAYRKAAETNYWMNDQGTGKEVDEAFKRYEDAQEALYKYLDGLFEGIV